MLHLQGKLPPEQDAFMQPSKPAEELYDLRNDPHETPQPGGPARPCHTLKMLRAELDRWRQAVGDPGVSEEFRKGAWPATYPTRSLAEWQEILGQWEKHILHDGPRPADLRPRGISARGRHDETAQGITQAAALGTANLLNFPRNDLPTGNIDTTTKSGIVRASPSCTHR